MITKYMFRFHMYQMLFSDGVRFEHVSLAEAAWLLAGFEASI